MSVHLAFLRAVNVGGTGKLPMAELRALCEGLGFDGVRTHIQSGNVVLKSDEGSAQVRAGLEEALERRLGKPVAVHVRTPDELADILDRNPFEGALPNRVLVYLLDGPVPEGVDGLTGPAGEEVHASAREVFVHYPEGQGRSKLRLPLGRDATARNLNTMRKMLELGRAAGSQ
ncbi:MAG: hypothetical protein AMS19_13825 [Gemmatimonas sp. SG8_23]|jgi:uncharacterized protein (DUF1697 family)|nr:MAG: hypothetical protein AMS19_13825 [Gemmatimonas sp. SG8_23]